MESKIIFNAGPTGSKLNALCDTNCALVVPTAPQVWTRHITGYADGNGRSTACDYKSSCEAYSTSLFHYIGNDENNG